VHGNILQDFQLAIARLEVSNPQHCTAHFLSLIAASRGKFKITVKQISIAQPAGRMAMRSK
jgi:hypothetical protein